MKRICVYCGSSPGWRAEYEAAAASLGAELLRRGIGLVYGGASKGLMGVLADAVLAGGGKVTGVIPRALVEKEVAHAGLTELQVVESMHERKSAMARASDAFIAMPGGFGTIEEIVEALTWGQLGLHDKPCGLLNVAGYFDRLLAFLDHAEAEGFLRSEHRRMLPASDDPCRLIDSFADYSRPDVQKWIEAEAR